MMPCCYSLTSSLLLPYLCHLYVVGGCVIPLLGCGSEAASNYDSMVTQPDVKLCVYPVLGCTDSVASNYLSTATVERSPSDCAFGGCMDPGATNYDPSATFSLGVSACTFPVSGCTESIADNFLSSATVDDGSCIISGCMQVGNALYDPRANQPPAGAENGGCLLMRPGCTNSYAQNYEASANTDDGNCFLLGCTNPLAPNYDSWATTDNGKCDVGALGCTNSNAANYQSLATADNGLCQIIGCMDSLAINFMPDATVSGVLCEEARVGCTNSVGLNYDVSYNVDSGRCVIPGCTDSAKLGYSTLATTDLAPGLSGACVEPKYGCIDLAAANFNSTANWDDGTCTYKPPPSPPYAGPPPSEDFLVLGLGTSYTLAELASADLQASVLAFIAAVPTSPPDWAKFGRRLQEGELHHIAGDGRRLQSTYVAPTTMESLSGWVANSDWQIEYARRIARSYWLPPSSVTLSNATETSSGTLMTFNIRTTALPAGVDASGLKAYAETVPSSLYSDLLAIPITSVTVELQSEILAAMSTPPPPSAPLVVRSSGMAPGVIVAIVLPIVAILLIGGVGGYWYRQRKMKRMPMATVQPEGPGQGGQILVRPPDIPE